MALVKLNLKPDAKHLRDFGTAALVMSLLAGLLLMWRAGLPLPGFAGLLACGTTVFLLSRISTRLVRPVYVALVVLAFPIGWVISHVLMGLFYFVVIGGTGLVFRLLKRDPLNRRYDRQAESYWIARSHPADAERYFRQF